MDQPPTVTSIEALDHEQRAQEYNRADRFSRRGRSSEDGPNLNRRDIKTYQGAHTRGKDWRSPETIAHPANTKAHNIEEANNLTRIIERSISATSSLIGRS
jgi:hypothetical protein